MAYSNNIVSYVFIPLPIDAMQKIIRERNCGQLIMICSVECLICESNEYPNSAKIHFIIKCKYNVLQYGNVDVCLM